MLASLKSEFKKLLTIRSTYLLSGFVLLLVTFLAVYMYGYKQADVDLLKPDLLEQAVLGATGLVAIIVSVVAILHVTHEYRYNTITYTLTATNHRFYVLGSKVLVALVYATALAVSAAAIAYFGTKLGVQLSGRSLSPQNLPSETLWQVAAYIWGNVLFAFIIAVLVRAVVTAVTLYFVIPTVEMILRTLVKENGEFFPFQALGAIVGQNPIGGLTSGAAIAVVAVYVLVFGAIATVLFVRRDAN